MRESDTAAPKQPQSSKHFPKNFLWGASTAAHQVEGGNHNQWTVWELEHARVKAVQASFQLRDSSAWDRIKSQATNPDNYVSGELADHYHRYEEDFDLLKSMHMNAYRFSIEWSRLEPKEGIWDAAEIDHYRLYLGSLKKRSIEPVVTLFHFTLPVWFTDKGGFERRSNVKYFTRYVEKVIAELGKDIRIIITINEPEVYASESYYNQNWPPARSSKFLWWRVVNNMALAHNRAAKIIHSANRRYKVSIAKNSNYFYSGDNAWLSRVSANIMQYFQDDYFIRKTIKNCDFLGVNYYFANRVYGYRIHNPDQIVSDLSWDLEPANIEYVLERLNQKYHVPLLITENGLADATDEHRKWWISQTIMAMQRARERGVNLQGYLHWSLMDNFEWAYGKWPRFGLASVDYATGRRKLRPSAVWFGTIIKRMRGL